MRRILLGLLGLLFATSAQAACPTTTLTFKDAAGTTQTLCFGGGAGAFTPQHMIMDSAGTNLLTVTAAGAAKVDASATTQPVNLTTVAAALHLSTNVDQIGGTALALGQTTMAASIPITIASNQSALTVAQATAANLNATVTGTITANAGTNLNTSALALDTSVNGILVGQGSTTSGEKGPLIQGAVTTSSPSYTTAQTSPLSLTTAGALRVDATATTQPISGTITANAGTGNFAVNIAQINGSTVSTAATGIMKIGLTDGSGNSINSTTNALNVDCTIGCQGGSFNNNSDAVATSSINGQTAAWLYGFNGASFDRLRVDANKNLLVNVGAVTQGAPGPTPWPVLTVGPLGQVAFGAQLTKQSIPVNIALDQVVPVSGTIGAKSLDGMGNIIGSTAGALNVAIVSGGGTGGTASTFGAAFPTTGTATGFDNGSGNMDFAKVDASHNLMVNVQSSVLPTGAATSALQTTGNTTLTTINTTLGSPLQDSIRTTIGAGTAPTSAAIVGLQFLSSPPTLTNGQTQGLLGDNGGRLIVNCQSGCSGSGGTSIADEATFTPNSTSLTPAGGFFQTNPIANPVPANAAGAAQITQYRALFVNLRGTNGQETGSAQTPLYVQNPAEAPAVSGALFAGQQFKAKSVPVTMALDQPAIPVNLPSVTSSSPLSVATPDLRQTDQTLNSAVLNSAIVLPITNNQSVVALRIDGLTASTASLAAECTVNYASAATVWQACSVFQRMFAPTSILSPILLDGVYRIPVSGIQAVRLRISVAGAGTVTISTTESASPGFNAGGFVQPVGGAIGGMSVFSEIVPNNTTSISIAGTPATLYGVSAFNNSGTIAYIKLYNATQGSVTCGAPTPTDRMEIPANTSGAGFIWTLPLGAQYNTAITACITGGIGDADTTAPAANAYLVSFYYKN